MDFPQNMDVIKTNIEQNVDQEGFTKVQGKRKQGKKRIKSA